MKLFIWTLKVQLLLFSVALAVSNTTTPATVRRESSLITNFLQKFIKPFLRTTHVVDSPKFNATAKRGKEAKIAKVISKKVAALKHLLEDGQDNEKSDSDDNLTLRGNDETTVIEFLPQGGKKGKDGEKTSRAVFKPDPLKTDINRYKLLREQIEIALDEERISKETKNLILNTLDEMLAQLIESQCTWNPTSHSIDKRLLKAHNDTHDSIAKVRGMTKKQWKQLKHQYLDYLNHKMDKENAFMNEFHQFFTNVINDTYNLAERYKIKCELVEMYNDEKPNTKLALRQMKTSDAKNQCDQFKVCSEELKEFLMEFFTYVNDTAVSTFTNYAEMYVRDVNVDFGLDKNVVITVINNLGSSAEGKVIKIYKKAVKKFTLDPNKLKSSNIKLITTFIKNVVTYVKTAVKENLVQELGAMKTKLFLTVKEDLLVNLEVDMENLERHYIETLCSMFLSCNGRSSTRRQAGTWSFRPRANSEVFVKVQLSLDDEMKDAVVQSGLLKIFDNPENMKYKLSRKNLLKSEITRTTLNINSTTTRTHEHEHTHSKHGHHHKKKHTHTGKGDVLRNTTILTLIEENEINKI